MSWVEKLKKLISWIMLALLLACMPTLTFKIKPVECAWTGTVYIRNDGSIDPTDAPIVTSDNITYTLTDDIIGSIVIEKSYITLDGAGYALRGLGTGCGVFSDVAVNITVRDLHISGFQKAIEIGNKAHSWVITNNTITNNTVGITLGYLAYGNVVSENYIANNNNTGIIISGDSTSNNIVNNTITGSTFGIYITTTFGNGDNVIVGNNIVNNEYGVFISNSNDDIFYHNNFILNTIQVYIYDESISTWDNGAEGNYWSDYDGTDSNKDGIGDTPYIINENNTDRYPLMQPWASPWGDWSHYHNYSEIVNTLLYLNETYPDIVDVYPIGKSWCNRSIYCVRLTNESNQYSKPKALFVGYHHAREPISAELPLYFTVYATTNFGKNETITYLLNYSEIYIIPALNVDGFEVVAQNGWQRKNAHPFDEDGDGLLDEDPPDDEDGDGYIEYLFYWDGTNYYFIRWEGVDDDGDGLYNEDWVGGVDLNRNYGYQWNASCQSGSTDPRDEDYRGPAPFSEPETRAMRDLALQHHFKYAISFHSGAECIVYPWGHTTEAPPDEEKFIEVASEIAQITGVWYGQSGDWYTTSGVWDDWMYGNRSTYAFTCEIYKNDSAWQYEPGPDPNTWWEKGILEYFNPLPNKIEETIQRWLPVFIYITNRTINESFRNLAITDLTSPKTIVGQGLFTNTTITVNNYGDLREDFNVTLYANTTIIQTVSLSLEAHSTITLTFSWNTSELAKGNYTLWAYISPVQGEANITDNTFIGDILMVTIPGDIDGDYDVDILDVIKITAIYASEIGDPEFNPNSDLDNDGVITILDVILCTTHYGEKYP